MRKQLLSVAFVLSALLILLTLSPSVSSQEAQPAKPVLRDLSPISIIRLFYTDEQLRTHLSISQEQIKKFEQLFEELEKEAQTLQGKYEGKQPTPELVESRRNDAAALQKRMTNGFAEILSSEQMKSFNIIRFQILGGFDSPLANSESLGIFDLSEEQIGQIDVLVKERQQKIAGAAEILRERPESQEQARERIMQVRRQGIEISKEYGKKIRDLLTPEQQSQAEKWLQESVELRKLLTPYLPIGQK